MHPIEERNLRRMHNSPASIQKLAELFGFIVDTDPDGQMILYTGVKLTQEGTDDGTASVKVGQVEDVILTGLQIEISGW